MKPSKNQGLRLTSKYTEGLADVVITQLSLPRTPLKGKGLWELILGAVLGGAKHPLPSAPFHTPQPGMWKAAGPEPLSCWSAHLHNSATCIYLCGYPKMTRWLWKSPRCAHTESLSVSNVISCTNGWDVTPSVFQGCSVLLQSSACFNMKVMT